ncbi:M28 family peptidase [Deminuibacter soli]|uniref:Peptidase M28 n=1 Tax=Deminuibacter soli TaxID=2291815 RepID=A0A3E1NRC4_9BACT|nr:M28 family peptidase [Deminuibacter soli]RFM30450.1 peptidase M28 [Deminuibacter soli]
MRKQLLPVVLALTASVTAMAQDKNAAKYAEIITAADLKAKLSIIAGAEMQGRETTSPGQRKAAAFIENHFKTIGLKPGATNGYQQLYPVYEDSLAQIAFSVNGKDFKFGEDISINPSSLTDTTATIKEVVLAGFGIKDSIYDDYKDLDVKGKCVLIADGEPKLENGNYLLSGTNKLSRAGNLRAKVMYARAAGAAMVLVYQPRIMNIGRTGQMYVNARAGGFNTILVTAKVLEAITPGLSKDADTMIATGHSLSANFTTAINLTLKKQVLTLQSSNVIGILPGTDKKDEYVFVTGHYDHLGINNGQIYYGADDDGSGTTSVLEIAQAFAKAKAQGHGPRRSMVFMTVSGEEKGLLGSEYFTAHPTIDLSKASVDLNIDMVGRIDPDYKGDSTNYVYVIGEDKLSSDLLPISDSINKTYAHMELDRRFNDPKDPNRFYYRSDHFNFAKNGVPVIFYFNGVHADYHRPTDTVDKINFPEMEKRVKLVFFTAWEMSNRDNMLKRDIPLK